MINDDYNSLLEKVKNGSYERAVPTSKGGTIPILGMRTYDLTSISYPEETSLSTEVNLRELILNHFNDTENFHQTTTSQTGAITRKEYLQKEKILKKEINKLRKKIKKLKNHK